MIDRSDIDVAAIRQALEAERHDLLADSETTAENRKPVELDQQSVGRLSRMDAMQTQAMAKAVEQQRQSRRRQVDTALARLNDGDYGYCAGCDGKIPVKRLQIDPAITLCVKCAR